MKNAPNARTTTLNIDRSFRRFRLGLSLCITGFVVLYSADQMLEPSLMQEIVAAFALISIGVGIGLALAAELMFIFYRVALFFSSK